MKIELRAFSGEVPRLQPHLLPPTNAIVARNTNLVRAAFEPFASPLVIATLSKVGPKLAIWRMDKNLDSDTQYWLHWLADTDVSLGPLRDDPQERTYFTEAGQLPRVTDKTLAGASGALPLDFYTLGLPAPASAPTLSVSGSGSGTAVQILAGYTYVSGWDEEGPMSAVSAPASFLVGQSITIGGMDTAGPVGDFNATKKRLYVSETDATGATRLLFFAEVDLAQASYTAALDLTLLTEEAQSPSPVMPPATLFGIAAHPNSFLIGFSGKKFCRSEVFMPHAWPTEYQDPVDYDIVGGAILGQSTVICTKGPTYLSSGSDPLSQIPIRLEGDYPCASKRSIKAASAGVIYASPDGLVSVSPSGQMALITRGLFTRKQWQTFNPSSMHAIVHDDRYYCWWSVSATNRGLMIFDFTGDGIGVVHSDIYATAAFADPRRDELFLALPADNDLYKWDADRNALKQARWRSRRFVIDRPQNIGAGKVIGDIDCRCLTLRLYADGRLRHTQTVTDQRPFRMKMGYRAREYEVELEGTATVRELHLAGSIAELASSNG